MKLVINSEDVDSLINSINIKKFKAAKYYKHLITIDTVISAPAHSDILKELKVKTERNERRLSNSYLKV